MELKEFIERIADQFDDTDISEFVPTTNFKELEKILEKMEEESVLDEEN